jgi:hypothetical protein
MADMKMNVESFLPGFNYSDFMMLMQGKANRADLDQIDK